eukprot:SAG22_NODE_1090_length_5597_cov_6.214987_3_plen_128_part_01
MGGRSGWGGGPWGGVGTRADAAADAVIRIPPLHGGGGGPTGCPYAAHLNCSRVGTVCAAFGDGGCDGAARTLLLSNASGLDACRGACEAMNVSGCCVLSDSPAGPQALACEWVAAGSVSPATVAAGHQ